MVSKRLKSDPSIRVAKSEAEVPPVPFVASATSAPSTLSVPRLPKVPTVKSVASRRPALAKAIAKPAPTVPVAATLPVVEVASAPELPAAIIPDVEPEPVPTLTPTPISNPAIAPATAVMQKDISTMDDTINTATDTAQAEAKTMFADVNDHAKSAMEKGSQMISEMTEFSKGNLEAVVASSKIAAKGAEEMARYTSDYVRTTAEKASATASQFATIKSPAEFFKLHSDLTKQAMDSMMAETAKFTENYVKLLGEIAQPISNRVAIAVEKVKVAA